MIRLWAWFLKRQLWQREPLLMLACLILSVFTIYLLSHLGDRLQQGLEAAGSRLLGADRVLSATRPADPEWLQQAQAQQLQIVSLQTFRSMAFAGDQLQLVRAKALNSDYPAKGELLLKREQKIWSGSAPESGHVWADQRLQHMLNISLDDQIEIGNASFKVAAWIQHEPDAGLDFFGGLPRLMLNQQDVAATRVIQPGSRVSYSYLISGVEEQLQAFDRWLKPQLNEIYRYRGVKSDGFALAGPLERSSLFLRLAALLTVLLTLAALVLVCQQYCASQQTTVALLKAMGSPVRQIGYLYAGYGVLLFLLAAMIGLGIGQGTSQMMLLQLQQRFADIQTGFSMPLAGFAIGLSGIACLVMLLPYFARLLQTTPMQLFRQGRLSSMSLPRWRILLLSLVTWGMAVWLAQNVLLATSLLLGLLVCVLLIQWSSRGLIHFMVRFVPQDWLALKLAVSALQRRLLANQILLAGFTLAALLVLVITYARKDLLEDWQQQLPAGSANYFALNIQPYQKQDFEQQLQRLNAPTSFSYPVVQGRVVQHNGQAIDSQHNGLRRELSLTARNSLPEGNALVAGEPFDGVQQVSVESSIAEDLQLELGDTLTYEVGALSFEATVQNIRSVNWSSMRPNFYMIFSEDMLAQYPHYFLTSFYLAPERQLEQLELARQFPTVTLINVDTMLERLSVIIAQSSLALTLILLLVCCAASLLLFAQVQISMQARKTEVMTLFLQGASRPLLTGMVLFEFIVLGALAGLIAAASTEAFLAFTYQQWFQLQPRWHTNLWLIGPCVSAALVALLGWLQTGRLLRQGIYQRLRLQL